MTAIHIARSLHHHRVAVSNDLESSTPMWMMSLSTSHPRTPTDVKITLRRAGRLCDGAVPFCATVWVPSRVEGQSRVAEKVMCGDDSVRRV
jgi:hypothetical protein